MNQISKPIVAKFLANEPTKPMTATRAILVFGKNSATYKFALIKTLCELEPRSELSYDEIGPTFLRHLVRHHEHCPHQFNRRGTVLSKAMDEYLSGSLEWSNLYDIAERNIFNNVFDATHNVGGGSISHSARLFEHLKADRKIVVTDNLNSILDSDPERQSLAIEAERRWEVVEEGWRSGVPQSPIANSSDDHVGLILGRRRPSPRFSVPILHSLQKGRCFYCNKHMNLENQDRDDPNFPDEEHFIPQRCRPHILNSFHIDVFEIWNLVVACAGCNRLDEGNKRDKIPAKQFHEKLLTRNLGAILEHGHQLKKSIQWSMGIVNARQLEAKHRMLYDHFTDKVWQKWSPKELHGSNWYDYS